MACSKASNSAWKTANKTRNLEVNRAWEAANKYRIAAKKAAYYQANKEKKRAYNAARYPEIKERMKITGGIYYLKNKEKVAEYGANWKKENQSRVRIHNLNRRSRRQEVGGKLSIGLSEKLFKLQKGKCPCCREPLGDRYHMDHIVPLALGGSNTDENMQLLRSTCNQKKHVKHPVQFMQERGYLL